MVQVVDETVVTGISAI